MVKGLAKADVEFSKINPNKQIYNLKIESEAVTVIFFFFLIYNLTNLKIKSLWQQKQEIFPTQTLGRNRG